MDKDELDLANTSYRLKSSSETLLPIQFFEFRTHLLEAVEELRMGRLAKVQYEEQINKILMEKQELAWKNESLSNQEEILEKRHKDALAVLKQQLQAKMCTMEEEKGRFQLAAEAKEREVIGLREDIKSLQIAKYNLQKKVQEMEQKQQLHILAKEDGIKQLSECEKCFGNVTQQFGVIKEVHERLEQNVQVAIQNNKKLKSEMKQNKDEIDYLKEEFNKLSSDYLNYKVTHQQSAGEEKFSLCEKDQQLKELRERLQTEKEINSKLMEVNVTMKEEKEEDIRTLNSMVAIVQQHIQTITNLDKQLSELLKDYKTLERDNELQRAKATENEEKFLALHEEHEKALRRWKEQEGRFVIENGTIKKELKSIQEAYKYLQEGSSESLNNKPQTALQVQMNQNSSNSASKQCDPEDSTSVNIMDDPVDGTMFCDLEGRNAPEKTNGIKKKEENKLNYVHKDENSLPNVNNILDKAHVSEEQEDKWSHTENKDSPATSEQNIEECCDRECIEDIPADTACLNDVDEREAECSTIQTQAEEESVKTLLDNNKPPAVCSEDASQQTDSSNRKSADGTSEVVYIVIDKGDTTENSKGVLVNEMLSQKSKLFPEATEQLINSHSAVTDDATAGNSTSCVFGEGCSSYISPDINQGTPEMRNIASNVLNKENLTNHIYMDDQKSFELVEDVKSVHKDVISLSGANPDGMDSKSLGQDIQLSTSALNDLSFGCHEPAENVSSIPALNTTINNQDCQSLQHTEGTYNMPFTNSLGDLDANCPQEDNASRSDIGLNEDKSLKHMEEQTGDQKHVEKENSSVQDENYTAVTSTHEEDHYKPHLVTKKSINNQDPFTACNILPKLLLLPRTSSWSSQSSSKQSGYMMTEQSPPEDCATAEHGPAIQRHVLVTLPTNACPVPKRDHSDELNSTEQTFHNPSFPREHSAVLEKHNSCPLTTDVTSTPDSTIPEPQVQRAPEDNCSVASIQSQINAIEKFLIGHRMNRPIKRKLEDCIQTEEPDNTRP